MTDTTLTLDREGARELWIRLFDITKEEANELYVEAYERSDADFWFAYARLQKTALLLGFFPGHLPLYAAYWNTGFGAALARLLRPTIGQPGGITQEDYDTVSRPWAVVIGKVHPDDPDHGTPRPARTLVIRAEETVVYAREFDVTELEKIAGTTLAEAGGEQALLDLVYNATGPERDELQERLERHGDVQGQTWEVGEQLRSNFDAGFGGIPDLTEEEAEAYWEALGSTTRVSRKDVLLAFEVILAVVGYREDTKEGRDAAISLRRDLITTGALKAALVTALGRIGS